MKRYLIGFFVLLSSVAISQDITNHSVPIGGGPGAVGWKAAGPCTAGQALVWAGVTSDPTCTSVSGSGSTPGGSNLNVQYNNAGTFGGLTDTQLTARINAATVALSGALPAWPGNTTTFFRGDGSYAAVTFPVVGGSVALSQLPLMLPGGRLVATNAACGAISSIQLTDVAVANVLCYVPHASSVVPINAVNRSFSTLQFIFDATHHTLGNNYDVFAVMNSGSPAICTGPAWTSPGPAAPSRAVNISKSGALWTNSGTVANCWNNGADLGSFTAGQATYLGTTYVTINGGTQWVLAPTAATGGTNNVLGLFNAYNQEPVTAVERDLTPNWNYVTADWRPENNSTANRITVVDGLGLSQVFINFLMTNDYAGGGGAQGGTTSVCIDCVYPGFVIQVSNQAGFDAANQGNTMNASGVWPAVGQTTLGTHYYQAMEHGNGVNWELFGNTFSGLFVTLKN